MKINIKTKIKKEIKKLNKNIYKSNKKYWSGKTKN